MNSKTLFVSVTGFTVMAHAVSPAGTSLQATSLPVATVSEGIRSLRISTLLPTASTIQMLESHKELFAAAKEDAAIFAAVGANIEKSAVLSDAMNVLSNYQDTANLSELEMAAVIVQIAQ